jgi:hypothetical protein
VDNALLSDSSKLLDNTLLSKGSAMPRNSRLSGAAGQQQSELSAKYEKSSKFWRTFTLIAVPAAALLSGGIVLAATQ